MTVQTKRSTKFAKASSIYFAGNVFSKTIVFFMLPIYTRYLTAEEYGIYDLLTVNIQLVASFLFFESGSMILRFLLESKEKSERESVLSNACSLFAYSSVAYFCLIIVGYNLLRFPYAGWLCVYGFFYIMFPTIGYIARGFGMSKLFSIAGICSAMVTAVSNIVLIVFMGLRVEAMFVSAILGYAVEIILFQRKIHIHQYLKRACLSSVRQKEMALFAFPLALTTLTFWMFTAFNKNIIAARLSVADAGIYAISNKFATIFFIVMSGIAGAWQEMAFAESGDLAERGAFFSRALNRLLMLTGIFAICFLPAVKIVFPFMVTPEYSKAAAYIPLGVLATVISLFSGFLGSIAGNIKHTYICTYSTAIGALVNVAFMLSLTSFMGVQAANLSL